VRITAEGRSLRGAPFTREALRTAAVWAGGDRPPPNATDEDWCNKLGCLIDSGVLNPEVLKQFGIDVGRLGKCCPPDEPEGGGRLILRPNQTPRRPQARARKRTRRRK
jgi:hypothetical protein